MSSVAVEGDLYVNNSLGFAFRKPAGWRFEHLRTFADLRDEYDFATPDAELVAELKSGPLPLAVVSQAPILHALASSMTVYAEQSPLRPGETLSQAMPDIVRGNSRLLEAFEVVQEPRAMAVTGAEAIEYAATFLYKDRLGNRLPVRNRSLILLRRPVVYTLNMLDIPARNILAESEFHAIGRSVVLS